MIFQAPLTFKHFQVTGYGEDGVGDVNDIWRIEIVGNSSENQILETMNHRFRLVQITYLFSLLSVLFLRIS